MNMFHRKPYSINKTYFNSMHLDHRHTRLSILLMKKGNTYQYGLSLFCFQEVSIVHVCLQTAIKNETVQEQISLIVIFHLCYSVIY